MNEKIRIFLADDHKMLRESLIMLLSQEDDFEITGQAADGIQLCRSIYDIRGETDIVLMDISMPSLPLMPPSSAASTGSPSSV